MKKSYSQFIVGGLLLFLFSAYAAAPEPDVPCFAVRDSSANVFSTRQNPPLNIQNCKANNLLSGTGDLLVTIKTADPPEVAMPGLAASGTPLISLNGVVLHDDAELQAVEVEGVDNAGQFKSAITLRYRLSQGKEVQRLWSMLYVDGALFMPEDLRVALVWKSANGNVAKVIPAGSDPAGQIRIVTGLRLTVAAVLLAFLIMMVIYVARNTDVMRDAGDGDIPSFWKEAQDLKTQISGLTAQQASAFLANYRSVYSAQNHAKYDTSAADALAGEIVQTDDIVSVTFGLALNPAPWKPVRATYSLARTQLALWFTFVVGTGLFLWLLFGNLPTIDGSMLVLLGISSGTAGYSWTVDQSMNNKSYIPSRGFWSDLMTGFDTNKHIYRYQAVFINMLLVIIGIYQVTETLAPPEFNESWLFFLGISGATYGTGKTVLEKKG